MKLISLIGARPQIIKEAILNQEFEKEGIEEILVHSGQHYDFNMSDVFFKVLNIRKADYNLGIGSGTHAEMTGKTMIEFEKVVLKERPDIILVYGNTNRIHSIRNILTVISPKHRFVRNVESI